MDEETDQEEPPPSRHPSERPDVAERIRLRKDKETSVVQTGWRALCQDMGITDLIEQIIPEVTRIRVETCLLLNLHFIRLLEEGKAIPVIDQNLVGRAMQSTYSKRAPADPDLYETFEDHYLPLCVNRPANSCLSRISDILLDQRNQLLSNLKNHVAVHFEARHRAFVRLLLEEAAREIPFLDEVKEDLDSCTRLLTTATLWRPNESIEQLLPEFPRLYGNIPPDAAWRLQALADAIRPLVGPLPAAPAVKPYLYLPWMYCICREFSDRGRRTFALVPHAAFSAPFLVITPTTWPELLPKAGKRKAPDVLLDAFPAIKGLTSRGKSFANRITTDKVSASVHLLVNKRGAPKEDRKVTIHLEQRVVGLDPGKNPDFLTGVVVQGDWDGIERQSGDIRLGTREFYHRAGFKKRAFMMSQWMAREVDVAGFNERAPSGDGLGLEEFGRRVTAVSGSMYALIRFHTARRVRKLRRRVTVQKHREVDRVCAEITGGKVAVVAFGAAVMGKGRAKGQCGPCEAVRRRLSSHHRATVVMVEEFRTSRMCSTCLSGIGGFRVLRRRRIIEDGMLTVSGGGDGSHETCHNVRACTNPLCRIVWNRDVNAVRNIAWICMSITRGEGRPAEFTRAGVWGG
jgi:hypothetical protein